ncbi:MAG TPA: thiamine biosynthesis protein ApbE, partial [Planctomycetaceae bacterium]|nr:thiamine biosynthesis protein ApbE [Planctomycetaceae bacterium]
MGTSYMVKIFDPPRDLAADWREQIDAELRRVNDQMSTYLESSELSRFNRSDSTDWFEVSPETVMVVAKSLEIFELSGGAFEITIAPLVNAWSFGPGKRQNSPPDDATIASSLENVGSDAISVRTDPPAIRKSNPRLTIDLSAIAKGHGVDRIVGLVNRLGARNVFVEIGGEVRVTGDKAGKSWTVGIQKPDVAGEVVAVAYPIADQSIATSGDYRNFFEYEGVRYSHTIDPRTGRPVNHDLASVSVVAQDCMTADAWATALNVLGTDEGLKLAEKVGLNTLLISRVAAGGYKAAGTGTLAALATSSSESSTQLTTEKAAENPSLTL